MTPGWIDPDYDEPDAEPHERWRFKDGRRNGWGLVIALALSIAVLGAVLAIGWHVAEKSGW